MSAPACLEAIACALALARLGVRGAIQRSGATADAHMATVTEIIWMGVLGLSSRVGTLEILTIMS